MTGLPTRTLTRISIIKDSPEPFGPAIGVSGANFYTLEREESAFLTHGSAHHGDFMGDVVVTGSAEPAVAIAVGNGENRDLAGWPSPVVCIGCGRNRFGGRLVGGEDVIVGVLPAGQTGRLRTLDLLHSAGQHRLYLGLLAVHI